MYSQEKEVFNIYYSAICDVIVIYLDIIYDRFI